MTNDLKILIEVKNHYGNELYYPACDIAKAFAKLAGCKTLTPQALKIIKAMKYEIKINQPNLAI